MGDTYFDVTRDKQFAYFCQTCLVGKTEEEISKRDIRYCVTCQPFVESEYTQLRQRYTPAPYNDQNPQNESLSNADVQIPQGSKKRNCLL